MNKIVVKSREMIVTKSSGFLKKSSQRILKLSTIAYQYQGRIQEFA